MAFKFNLDIVRDAILDEIDIHEAVTDAIKEIIRDELEYYDIPSVVRQQISAIELDEVMNRALETLVEETLEEM